MSKKAYDFLNPVGTAIELVEGRGGSARHAGMFREDNPYLDDLRMAIKNQDKDAAYERAVEWDADVYSRHMQIAENKEILDEQRRYDSPEQQIARDRAAGINSDLAGSSGSSGSSGTGSAQLTNPGLPDVQAQTKFDNKYDNTALTLQGINTVANIASSFTGAFSSIVSSIDTLRTMPSRIGLSDATAKLRGAQANEINQLLGGRKKAIDLGNTSTALSNSTEILSTLAGLTDLISTDVDTAGISSMLSSLGIGETDEQRASYAGIMEKFRDNPEFRSRYAGEVVSANEAEAEAEQMTPEFFAGIVADNKRLIRYQMDWDVAYTQLQSKIAKLLNTDDYAQSSADLEYSTLGNQNLSQDIIGAQLVMDFESIGMKLQECSDTITDIDGHLERIKKDPAGPKGTLSSAQRIMVGRYELLKSQLMSSGSEKLELLYDIIAEVRRTRYAEEAYSTNSANYVSRPTAGFGSFGGYMFDQIHDRKASFGEVARELGGEAIIALGMTRSANVSGAATVRSSRIAGASRVKAAKMTKPRGYRKDVKGTKNGMRADYTENIDYIY